MLGYEIKNKKRRVIIFFFEKFSLGGNKTLLQVGKVWTTMQIK